MADANFPMNQDCLDAFTAVKDPKAPTSFVIFKIENERIVLEHVGTNTSSYTDFLSLLPPNDPRFCVYDYNYQNDEGHPRNKLVFIFWTPDTVHARTKMLYASGVKGLVRRLQGVQKEVQATDITEVQVGAIEASLRFA